MRKLAFALVLLVVNDVALALLLNEPLNASAVVILGAIVLSATVLLVVAAGVEDDGEPPTRQELKEEVASLRARVEELEN